MTSCEESTAQKCKRKVTSNKKRRAPVTWRRFSARRRRGREPHHARRLCLINDELTLIQESREYTIRIREEEAADFATRMRKEPVLSQAHLI